MGDKNRNSMMDNFNEFGSWIEPDIEDEVELIEICDWCGDPIEIEPINRRGLTFCCEECYDNFEYHNMGAGDHIYDNFDDPMYGDLNPCDFRDPGGGSALRNGPRIYPCPNCGRSNMLTPHDIALGYQCDTCADQMERGW